VIKINKRYLLFDSSCSECTRVAESFREISDDWLGIKSLHSDKIKSLLNEHHPNWKWEPQIIEFINDKVKVHSGIGMQFYILKGLGLRKSIRLSRVLKSVNLQNVSGRRRFLRKSSILFGGLLLSPILSTLLPKSFANKVSAEVSNSKNKHWLEKVDIVDSKELTSYEIEKSIGSTLQQDLKESTINNNIFMNSEKLGVIHTN